MYFVEEMRDEINRDEECGDRLFNDWKEVSQQRKWKCDRKVVEVEYFK